MATFRQQLQRVLEASARPEKHPHVLRLQASQTGEAWVCDGCEKEKIDCGRYQCGDGCDFDYCHNCAQASTSIVEGEPAKEKIILSTKKQEGAPKPEPVLGKHQAAVKTNISNPRPRLVFFASQVWPRLISGGTPLKSIFSVLRKKWADIAPKEMGKFVALETKDKRRYKADVDCGTISPGDDMPLINFTRKEKSFLFKQGLEVMEEHAKLIGIWDHDHNSLCDKCGESGEIIECDCCNVVYHPRCLKPKLDPIPTECWLCPECSEQVFEEWDKKSNLQNPSNSKPSDTLKDHGEDEREDSEEEDSEEEGSEEIESEEIDSDEEGRGDDDENTDRLKKRKKKKKKKKEKKRREKKERKEAKKKKKMEKKLVKEEKRLAKESKKKRKLDLAASKQADLDEYSTKPESKRGRQMGSGTSLPREESMKQKRKRWISKSPEKEQQRNIAITERQQPQQRHGPKTAWPPPLLQPLGQAGSAEPQILVPILGWQSGQTATAAAALATSGRPVINQPQHILHQYPPVHRPPSQNLPHHYMRQYHSTTHHPYSHQDTNPYPQLRGPPQYFPLPGQPAPNNLHQRAAHEHVPPVANQSVQTLYQPAPAPRTRPGITNIPAWMSHSNGHISAPLAPEPAPNHEPPASVDQQVLGLLDLIGSQQ